jgi:hypothetical protein
MGVAFRTGAVRLLPRPREPALRQARVCYDHLAGEYGVAAYEALLRRDAFAMSREELRLSKSGVDWFKRFGVDTDAAARRRRTFCRQCMDWSERRYHLAGSLGAALLSRFHELKWAMRDKNSRVVRFTPRGERAFRELFKTRSDIMEHVRPRIRSAHSPH